MECNAVVNGCDNVPANAQVVDESCVNQIWDQLGDDSVEEATTQQASTQQATTDDSSNPDDAITYRAVTFCVKVECSCDNIEGVVGIDCSEKPGIDCPKKCNFHELYQPAKSGYESCVDYQVHEMADVNARENGTSSIYQAVREGHFNIVSILFTGNAKINGTTDPDCESCTRAGDSLLPDP